VRAGGSQRRVVDLAHDAGPLPGTNSTRRPLPWELVNNARIFIPKPFTDYTEEDYNLVMNTNVASFFYMTQQVIPQMKKQNSGHVVNISAVLADQPSGAAPALLAVLSKSPMPAASKALAPEYAANNIRLNTVSPGIVNTPRRRLRFCPPLIFRCAAERAKI
jgi:NAD(P)-dependent dehydrogenase (short-subunit alcohol dehydrogenase family)